MFPLLAAAWALGLLGSLHCVAMCGGIVSMLSAGIAPDLRRRAPVHLGHVLAYNAGRVTSYGVLGAVAGTIAVGLRSSLATLEATQLAIRLFAGLVMLLFGLHLAGLTRGLVRLEQIGRHAWRRVAPAASRLLPVRSYWHAAALGGLWGLMPCGMVYAALAAATAAGRPIEACLGMMAFALGTVPAMALTGTVAGQVLASLGRRGVQRAAGLVVAGFAVASMALALPHAGPPRGHSTVCAASH